MSKHIVLIEEKYVDKIIMLCESVYVHSFIIKKDTCKPYLTYPHTTHDNSVKFMQKLSSMSADADPLDSSDIPVRGEGECTLEELAESNNFFSADDSSTSD